MKVTVAVLLFAVVSFNACAVGEQGLLFSGTNVSLMGNASGGRLHLVYLPTGSPSEIHVDTSPNEDAESVLKRLERTLWLNSDWEDLRFGSDSQVTSTVKGKLAVATLRSAAWFRGELVFAGKETALGIPQPAKSVSSPFGVSVNQVALLWQGRAEDDGECLVFVYNGCLAGWGQQGEYALLSRAFTERLCEEGACLGVVRFSSETPSNLSYIYVLPGTQEEYYVIPFTGGIAPNWTGWTQNGDFIVPSMEERPCKDCPEVSSEKRGWYGLDGPRLFQSVSGKPGVVCGGMWRKFLGLQMYHTYRFHVRLKELEQAAGSQWRFSVHACLGPAGREPLATEQMAGIAPLPDGQQGKDAGLVVRLGAEDEDHVPEWTSYATGDSDRAGTASDILIPASPLDAITVWLRMECEGLAEGVSMPTVGMDWICLEDLTIKEELEAKRSAGSR